MKFKYYGGCGMMRFVEVENEWVKDTVTGDEWEYAIECMGVLNQLSEREEQLLSEIDDFQELLAKNDNVCHERVIMLIDDKLNEYVKYDGYDTEKYYVGTQLLKELKKELLE